MFHYWFSSKLTDKFVDIGHSWLNICLFYNLTLVQQNDLSLFHLFSGSSHCSVQKPLWYNRRHYSCIRALMVKPHNHKTVAETYKPYHQEPAGNVASFQNAQFHREDMGIKKECRCRVQTAEVRSSFQPMARAQVSDLHCDGKGDWMRVARILPIFNLYFYMLLRFLFCALKAVMYNFILMEAACHFICILRCK